MSSPTAGTTRLLYDGDALVVEYNGGNLMARRHVHLPGADRPALTFEGADLTQPFWLHADHQGSIVALSAGNGAATINRYDEYGIPGAGNVGTFQYTGQVWLPELGMYHYQARIYSPTLGRFLQVDPIGYTGGVNLYAYVGNDPGNRADPTGTTDISLINQYDAPNLTYAADHFDMPGTVTVITHANPSGIGFRAGPAASQRFARVNQADLVAMINGPRGSLTQPVAMFGCRLAPAYARQLSRALGGRAVIATSGYVRPMVSRDGTVTMTSHDRRGNSKSFEAYGGRGWESFGINVPDGYEVRSISSNDRTGRFSVTMVGQDPGSRITQARVQDGVRPRRE